MYVTRLCSKHSTSTPERSKLKVGVGGLMKRAVAVGLCIFFVHKGGDFVVVSNQTVLISDLGELGEEGEQVFATNMAGLSQCPVALTCT